MKQRTSLSLGLRRVKIAVVCTFVTAFIALHAIGALDRQNIPTLFHSSSPASNVGQPGFVRITNRNNRSGAVRILAYVDTGRLLRLRH